MNLPPVYKKNFLPKIIVMIAATVLTPYSSIPDMFKQKVEWAVRCLNPGEDK